MRSCAEALCCFLATFAMLCCVPGAMAETAAPETAGPGDANQGAWRKIRQPKFAADTGPVLSAAEREALEAIGYLGGYEEVPDRIGVTHYDPAKAMDGYNLYTSGHAQEAYLTDMRGRLVHTWAYDAAERYNMKLSRKFWRRVHLAENGDLHAVCDPYGIIKLDRNSKLLWAMDGDHFTHHDLSVTPGGEIYALGKDIGLRPALHDTTTIIEDMILRIGPAGDTLDAFSMLGAFDRGAYGEKMRGRVKRFVQSQTSPFVETFHTNTIEVFDGTLVHVSPLLKKGNILCCSPIHSTVWIIDGDTRTVVWSWSNKWGQIHQPTFLPNGHWLLFHNSAYQNDAGEWRSQVLEYDFPDCNQIWSFQSQEGRPDTEFYSGTSSIAERLPNGNTLFTISESGRAMEVTPEKEVVWEFYNPKRAGARNDLIATLFQLERISRSYCASWLEVEAGMLP